MIQTIITIMILVFQTKKLQRP
ncbi:hypothetical protein DSUL_20160 [Desulfovibrionales bacterium]